MSARGSFLLFVALGACEPYEPCERLPDGRVRHPGACTAMACMAERCPEGDAGITDFAAVNRGTDGGPGWQRSEEGCWSDDVRFRTESRVTGPNPHLVRVPILDPQRGDEALPDGRWTATARGVGCPEDGCEAEVGLAYAEHRPDTNYYLFEGRVLAGAGLQDLGELAAEVLAAAHACADNAGFVYRPSGLGPWDGVLERVGRWGDDPQAAAQRGALLLYCLVADVARRNTWDAPDGDGDGVSDVCDCEARWPHPPQEICWLPPEASGVNALDGRPVGAFGRCRCDPGRQTAQCKPVEPDEDVRTALFGPALPPPARIAQSAVLERIPANCAQPVCAQAEGLSFEKTVYEAMIQVPGNATLKRDRRSTGFTQGRDIRIEDSLFGNIHAHEVVVPMGTRRYADMVRTRRVPGCGNLQGGIEALERFELKCRRGYELRNFTDKWWALDAEYAFRGQLHAYLLIARDDIEEGRPAFTTYVSCRRWSQWMLDIFHHHGANFMGDIGDPISPFWFSKWDLGDTPLEEMPWFDPLVYRENDEGPIAMAIRESDEPGGLHHYLRDLATSLGLPEGAEAAVAARGHLDLMED